MMIGAVKLVLAMIAYSKCASQEDETHLQDTLVENAPVSTPLGGDASASGASLDPYDQFLKKMQNAFEENNERKRILNYNQTSPDSEIRFLLFGTYDLASAIKRATENIQEKDKNTIFDYAALARILVILNHLFTQAAFDFEEAVQKAEIINKQYHDVPLKKENSNTQGAVQNNEALAGSSSVDIRLKLFEIKSKENNNHMRNISNTALSINALIDAQIKTLAKYKHLLSEEDLKSLNSWIGKTIGYKDALKALQNDRFYSIYNSEKEPVYDKTIYSDIDAYFLDEDKQASPRPRTAEKTDDDLSETTDDKKIQNLQVNEQNKSEGLYVFIDRVRTLDNANDVFMESNGQQIPCRVSDDNYTIEKFNIESALNTVLMMIENDIGAYYEHLGPLCQMLALLLCNFKLCKEIFTNLINVTKESRIRYDEAKSALEDKKRLSELENEVNKAAYNENAWYNNMLYNNRRLSLNIVDCMMKHSRDGEVSAEALSGYNSDLNGSYQNAYDKLQNHPFYKQFFGLEEVKPKGDGRSTFEQKAIDKENPVNNSADNTSKHNEIPARINGVSTQLPPPELQETKANENKKPTLAQIEGLTKQRAKILASLTGAKNYITKLKKDVLETSMKLESEKKIIDEKHNVAPEDEVLKKVRADSEYISKNLEIFIQELAEFLRDIENRIAEL
ncbi:hypothetical protein ENBRE01_3228, partial [Enteropsectra breve]